MTTAEGKCPLGLPPGRVSNFKPEEARNPVVLPNLS